MGLPKISTYAIICWVLSLFVYLINPLYLEILNYDARPTAILGMIIAFPFYFLTSKLERTSEKDDKTNQKEGKNVQ